MTGRNDESKGRRGAARHNGTGRWTIQCSHPTHANSAQLTLTWGMPESHVDLCVLREGVI